MEVIIATDPNPLSFTVDQIFYKQKPVEVISGGMGTVELDVPFVIPSKSFLSKN